MSNMPIQQATMIVESLPSLYPLQSFEEEALQTVLSATRWIPVTERLPEERGETYWICTDDGYQCQCRWTNNKYGLGTAALSAWGWHTIDKPRYSKVLAWMPLPERYREGEE